jgi:hypothetical protein
MSSILWLRTLICEGIGSAVSEICGLAHRALAAAQDSELKNEIQTLIDRICAEGNL